jgi:putative DNA primase/helicase
MNIFSLKTVKDTEEIFRYDPDLGIWKNDGEQVVRKAVEKILISESNNYRKSNTLGSITSLTYTDREFFKQSGEAVCLENGVFDFLTKTLKPFSPNPVFLNALPVAYDPKARCPNFEKFVNEILIPEDVLLLQEIMGYCLLPAMPYHKIFWFHGSGRNGKVRIIKTLEAILGKENIVQLNLKEFQESRRFSLSQLYGKLVNVSSEPDTKHAINPNILQSISGQDTISAEMKNKNKRIQFENVAKPIILGNNFPKVEKTTLAFWDRTETLHFPFSFIDQNKIPDIEKQWLSHEKSGILNWMLKGLYRLREQGKFSSSKTTEETKLEFQKVSDPFGAWKKEICRHNPEGKLERESGYESYRDYTIELGETPDSRRVFYAKMRRIKGVKEYITNVSGKTERGFKGIELKDQEAQEDQLPTNSKTVEKKYSIKKEIAPELSEFSELGEGGKV